MKREVKQMRYRLLGLLVVVMLLAMFPLTALACHMTNFSSNANCTGFTLQGQPVGGCLWVRWTVQLDQEVCDENGQNCYWVLGIDYQDNGTQGTWVCSPNPWQYAGTWDANICPLDGAFRATIWIDGINDGYPAHNSVVDGISCYDPTAVKLFSFEAKAQKNGIVLTWETASEIDTLGFNVYRAESAKGAFNQINATLIPSLVPPGSPVGAVYTYLDDTALPGIRYYYKLEDVDIYGEGTFHDPVNALIRPRTR